MIHHRDGVPRVVRLQPRLRVDLGLEHAHVELAVGEHVLDHAALASLGRDDSPERAAHLLAGGGDVARGDPGASQRPP
ncbi:MAG: hypothetical protein IPJ34_10575 [Myxococcales bacterium]|nr:hypothetical protein [Myxococcales bacterium]